MSKQQVVIAIFNAKGGVGKSTSTVQLSAGIARFGEKTVLAIDIGPQANTSSLFIGDEFVKVQAYEDAPSIYEVLTDDQFPLMDAVYAVELEGGEFPLDILPAKETLEEVRNMFPRLNRKEYRLGDALFLANKEIIEEGGEPHDFVIIDCPPSRDDFSLNALVACTHVLIPVTPGENNLKGMNKLLDSIQTANSLKMRNREKPIIPLGVVLTQVNQQTIMTKLTREKILSETDFNIIAEIPHLVSVQYAEANHQDLFAYDSRSKATIAYRKLVQEVLNATE